MHILLTNDDGIHAPGLIALRKALSESDLVSVVAPATDHSGISHALTLNRPLRVTQEDERAWAVDGTPTDAIFVALSRLLVDHPPDLVISGINPGPNMGCDVTYSGTVAAALEASLNGIPAMAVSCGFWPASTEDFAAAATVALELLKIAPWRANATGSPPLLLNVNLPRGATTPKRYELCKLDRSRPRISTVPTTDPRGKDYVWIGGVPTDHRPEPGSDRDAVSRGLIALTPLCLWSEQEQHWPILDRWLSERAQT